MFTVGNLIAFYRNAADNLTTDILIKDFKSSNCIPVRINGSHKKLMMYFINSNTGNQVHVDDLPNYAKMVPEEERVIPAFASCVSDGMYNLYLVSIDKIETIECVEYP